MGKLENIFQQEQQKLQKQLGKAQDIQNVLREKKGELQKKKGELQNLGAELRKARWCLQGLLEARAEQGARAGRMFLALAHFQMAAEAFGAAADSFGPWLPDLFAWPLTSELA